MEMPKNKWSKLQTPPDMALLLESLARRTKGYEREDVYRFVYHMVMTLYPQEANEIIIALRLDVGWIEPPPPTD